MSLPEGELGVADYVVKPSYWKSTCNLHQSWMGRTCPFHKASSWWNVW